MDEAAATDGRFRISTLADFEGIDATPAAAGRDFCTH
jgi:hypothetical protein